MNPSARITVNTGPDRGSRFEIIEESVQIGRAPENSMVLNDPLLAEQQINITRRGGRHAIFVSGTDEIEVDGTRIPPDRWVWLPQTALVQVTRRTSLEFISLLTASESDYEEAPSQADPTGRNGNGAKPQSAGNTATATSPPSAAKRGAGSKGDTKTGMKAKPAVARFITDQAGDPLVKLGADGHLPDLALQEMGTTVAPEKTPADQASKSLALVAAFVVSMGLSVAMLFLDLDVTSDAVQQSQVARKAITIFYGSENAPLEQYQKLLRRANLARSRGDYEGEKQAYREVLRMLRAENKNSVTGLTRLPLEASQKFDHLTITDLKSLNGPTDQFLELKNDERLERLLSILLRSD